MAHQTSALMQGVAAARAGDTHQARRLLSEAVRDNPGSAVAWLWLSSVLDTRPGRRYCLERVLALDPTNPAAQRGLAALDRMPAPRALVARIGPAVTPAPLAVARPAAAEPRARPELKTVKAGAARVGAWLARQGQEPRFWRGVVVTLSVIALALVAALVTIAVSTSRAGQGPPPGTDVLVAARAAPGTGGPAGSRAPVGTLRPTFTPVPSRTPVPTETPVPTPTATATALPPMLPTFSPTPPASETPTATATRARPKLVAMIAPPPTAAPRPTLPPLVWDPRLDALSVRVVPAQVKPGDWYWRLVEARWTDGQQSGGKHTIYVEVLDAGGHRAVGQPVVFEWSTGSVVLPVEDRPPPDWGANFAMYATLGSYATSVGGGPTDIVVGMGMGEPSARDFTIHTCFYLTFRRAQR